MEGSGKTFHGKGRGFKAGEYGNAGRNILIGPGTNLTGAGLPKSPPPSGERRRLTFSDGGAVR
jgi:hypothetical protein